MKKFFLSSYHDDDYHLLKEYFLRIVEKPGSKTFFNVA